MTVQIHSQLESNTRTAQPPTLPQTFDNENEKLSEQGGKGELEHALLLDATYHYGKLLENSTTRNWERNAVSYIVRKYSKGRWVHNHAALSTVPKTPSLFLIGFANSIPLQCMSKAVELAIYLLTPHPL